MTVRNVTPRHPVDAQIGSGKEAVLKSSPVTPDEQRHAVLVACDSAAGGTDAALLLDALGLTATAEGMGPGVAGHRRGCQCSSCRSIRTRNRARQRSAVDPSVIEHGTENGYQYYKCRCAPCTAAHSDYLRGRSQALREAAS